MDILRAVGKSSGCPTDVEPTDQDLTTQFQKISRWNSKSWYVNQYDNPSNAIAAYEQTGPEIWEQTEGKITHFVVGVGTGGTISGVAKYLRRNPNQNLGIDTYGSVFKKIPRNRIFDEKNEIYSYITEGIGEDILQKRWFLLNWWFYKSN
jgi:cystathionine beta-synthase